MNGFSLDSINCSVHNIYMMSKKTSLVPLSTNTFMKIPRRDGSYFSAGELNDIKITISCAVLDMDASAVREIAAWLYSKDQQILIFDEEPDKYYIAKIDGDIDLDPVAGVAEFSIVFRCEPFAYGVTPKVANFVADTVTVTNSGTFECFPYFTITFISGVASVEIDCAGELLKITKNFVIGDVLQINCAKSSIRLNGLSIMQNLDWQISKFFSLKPGSNIVSTPSVGVLNVAMSFNERWL